MMLTEHFSLREMTRSVTGERLAIPNEPLPWHIESMTRVAQNILEPVRAHFAKPVTVLSGFRSTRLNTAVNGARNSQHLFGEAVDFEVDGVPNAEVATWVRDNLVFDQLILEFYNPADPMSGWVHCSFSENINRGKVLTATRGKAAKVVYSGGILVA